MTSPLTRARSASTADILMIPRSHALAELLPSRKDHHTSTELAPSTPAALGDRAAPALGAVSTGQCPPEEGQMYRRRWSHPPAMGARNRRSALPTGEPQNT